MASGAWAAPYADYVIDARTGEVLHQDNANTRLHPASLTKMMTLYIAFEAIEHGEISLDTMVTVSKHAAAQPPSRLGLKPGQRIALRYLIRAAAIKSANDAATAIGEAIEGTESAFAKRMTRTAAAMGMSKTTFKNANGLTAQGHLSTAHDMTILGRRLFYDYPQYYGLFSRRTADAGMAQVASTNRRFLDSYEGADGIKTGYTSPAGFNLVASAQRGNKRIIATVFGGKSTANRNARVAELLDLGFGKAPNKAKTSPPPAIAYNGDISEPDEDLMAETIAANVDPSVPAAGKTIRLNVAVAESPRPRPRPLAAPLAIAAAEVAPDAEITAEAAEMAAATDDLMASLAGTIDAALAEANAEPAFEQTATPQPETLAMAEPAGTATPAPETTEAPPGAEAVAAAPEEDATAAIATASAIAPKATPVPPARPGATVTDAPTAVAEATPASEETAETALAANVIADPESANLPKDLEIAAAVVEPAATPVTPDDNQLSEAVLLTPPAPVAASDAATEAAAEVILASADTSADLPVEPKNPDLEIVTRVSTSDGREWGINVGSFSSRYNAERELLRTALVEMATLDEALRKVSSRKGAFDANFVGMTQEDAELACRRLSARGTECTVLSPAG
ncbi:serine hydrolase [Frigidibacter sp. SD6-1]|uniref:D-alanyl-D-alanine carboxypeptidase family protein n=1 Tax=Frigidibacter sp. SD6-1 TaxID=3032581 RepID=UPI0024DF51A1|nr:serine hydrolase [Frigidibacter sp. SD6-1]